MLLSSMHWLLGVSPGSGHWFMHANIFVSLYLKYANGKFSYPGEYPHCFPLESKGAASKWGCPCENAMTATAIRPPQNIK